MGFGRGTRLFSGFAYDNGYDTLALLRAATDLMRRRAAWLRGHTRLHAPTVDEPLVVVIIDEIASLTAYIGDRKGPRRS
jgi:DNA segregation ATPase FtsK/SpoIIIE, S-DNA-T family